MEYTLQNIVGKTFRHKDFNCGNNYEYTIESVNEGGTFNTFCKSSNSISSYWPSSLKEVNRWIREKVWILKGTTEPMYEIY